ncbi:uncharacterized protein NPIL_235191 [Nephila pilipes]|uniref:Uncharacterized protein n=1 Tax=Nephila pilipes TaxID=299642 RepID=A0A8X6I420_NEPPI|nr:uncharacterized protein NPIL_235191 [Nephila pilipes]
MYGILQRFTRGDLHWFHLMVKHDAFETFCKEIEKIRDQFALFPFWCLCDGMVSGTGRKQHRHVIMAYELESSFKDIWKFGHPLRVSELRSCQEMRSNSGPFSSGTSDCIRESTESCMRR